MKPKSPVKLISAILFGLIASAWCSAQTTNTPPAEDKAEKIVQRAIEVLGGDRYLQVKTVTGRGFFTDYKDGVSGIPVRFVDYISFPDRERTEFTGGGMRIVQTNFVDKGWIFDGAAKTLKDQTGEQLEDFKFGLRTGFENLLHGWWRKQGATLSYVGRREAGVGRRNETVRLTYADGFWIEYEFSANDGLPAKALYQRKHKKPDSEEFEDIAEEDRPLRLITIDGVVTPFVIDHFRAGIQTSRINYEKVDYNQPLADSLFAKPANLKAIK
ncbi:MAG TPA: hypothetical protein VHE60_19000 [Pyrinomonadaceae bacterium]|nr:hypothetical protein [Pyrinomonadaceae bacterium]